MAELGKISAGVVHELNAPLSVIISASQMIMREEEVSEFVREMEAWLREGRIKYREDITDGLENAPQELIRLLKGQNFGKKIIRT